MDKLKADKRKVIKKAIKIDSLKGYINRYKQELIDIRMAQKYTNKKLKKQLNAKARELRTRIKLIKDIENRFSLDVAFEIKDYYEKYGFEGIIAVLENKDLFPQYNFLTVNTILDYVDWSTNKKF